MDLSISPQVTISPSTFAAIRFTSINRSSAKTELENCNSNINKSVNANKELADLPMNVYFEELYYFIQL